MQKALFSIVLLFLCIACFFVSVIQTIIPYQWSLGASALGVFPAYILIFIYILILLALPLLAVAILWKQFRADFANGLKIMFARSKFYWMMWILTFITYMSIGLPMQLPENFAKGISGIGLLTTCLSIFPAFILLFLFVRDLGKGQKES